MNEAELVKRWQNGDLDAFRTLYEYYSARALRTGFLIIGKKDVTEDAVQDSFIQANKHIKKLKNPEKFRSWFYRILIRLSWQYSSKEKGKLSLDDVDFMIEAQPIYTSDLLEQYEIRQVIHDAVTKLSTPLKTVVILYYFNELSIKEIAQVLNCFEGTVKSRLHNARKFLRKELKEASINSSCLQQAKGV